MIDPRDPTTVWREAQRLQAEDRERLGDCPCGRELRPMDLKDVIGRSWIGCVGCRQAPEDCRCKPVTQPVDPDLMADLRAAAAGETVECPTCSASGLACPRCRTACSRCHSGRRIPIPLDSRHARYAVGRLDQGRLDQESGNAMELYALRCTLYELGWTGKGDPSDWLRRQFAAAREALR